MRWMPRVAGSCGAPHGGVAAPSYPERRVRSLYRLGKEFDAGEAVVGAVELGAVLAAQRLEHGDRLVRPTAALSVRHPERRELALQPADAHPQHHAPVGEPVE